MREFLLERPLTCSSFLIFVFVIKAFLNGKHTYLSGVCFPELVLKYKTKAKTLKLTYGVFSSFSPFFFPMCFFLCMFKYFKLQPSWATHCLLCISCLSFLLCAVEWFRAGSSESDILGFSSQLSSAPWDHEQVIQSFRGGFFLCEQELWYLPCSIRERINEKMLEKCLFSTTFDSW